MNNLFDESIKLKDIQPKLEDVFDEIKDYSKGYNALEKKSKV